MEELDTDFWSIALDALKWVGGILGAIGLWFSGKWAERRNRKRRIQNLTRYLNGLPDESKAILDYFQAKGTHTCRGNPNDPAVRLLIKHGIMTVGPGGGTYDAVDRYLTIDHEVWEILLASRKDT